MQNYIQTWEGKTGSVLSTSITANPNGVVLKKADSNFQQGSHWVFVCDYLNKR